MVHAVSFPLWLILFAVIGAPIHAGIKRMLPRGHANHLVWSTVTMILTMVCCLVIRPILSGTTPEFGNVLGLFGLSCCFGVVFGVPVGLIFRAVFGDVRNEPVVQSEVVLGAAAQYRADIAL